MTDPNPPNSDASGQDDDQPPDSGKLFPDLPAELAPRSLDGSTLSASGARQAEQAVAHLEQKMKAIAAEFARGAINQAQFQAIYTRYCEQRAIIERILSRDPQSTAWQDVVAEGQSGFLRRQYAAAAVGMVLVSIQSAETIEVLGFFDLPSEMLVPTLTSLLAGGTPAFEAGARSTQIEGGRWLVFVPGRYTASLTIFSLEPSASQIRMITGLHRDFETANAQHLGAAQVDSSRLVVVP